MIKDKIKSLRKLLQESSDFDEPQSAFLDLLDDPDFLEIGSRRENKELELTIEGVVNKMAPAVQVESLILIEIPELDFVHGALKTNEGVGTFFYFKKAKQGLVAISNRASRETQVARVTASHTPYGL